ncbi:MAG TPA: hypothetical protein VN765_17170 [Candidatus Acidoferrum sp.]|nr:hypothetical protein [Candidatus Acidoferrum sp.]
MSFDRNVESDGWQLPNTTASMESLYPFATRERRITGVCLKMFVTFSRWRAYIGMMTTENMVVATGDMELVRE